MTPARLTELRTVMAALSAIPIATLEAYPIYTKIERRGGIVLNAASPLAQQLTQLVQQTAKTVSSSLSVDAGAEVLYRMVVPAKVAAQMGKGLVKSMPSKAVAGGIYSGLRDSASVVANATFVPVGGKAVVAGAASGSAATAGIAVASAGALTVAAPLVLMALAVGVSAYADHQRQKAIERITGLLEELHEDKLDDERSELDGCRDAIDKATSILLDQGKIGFALGLDSAVHAISKSIERTHRRLEKWREALRGLPDGAVELASLTKDFPGIDGVGGSFRAHLEISRLAIALKRRVLILQAVEHAQMDGGSNPFASFIRTLQDDERRVDELEAGLSSVLLKLSSIELKHRGGIQGIMFTPGQVDGLLQAAYRLRALGRDVDLAGVGHDVAIEIERSKDGSLVVYPAVAA